MNDPATPRYLALGDSYTIGEGVAAAARWPVQLVARLAERGIALAPPQIVATTGWTTDELAQGIATSALDPPYALVSLLIGVNNQYRGRADDEYATQFQQLLRQAITFAGNRAERVLVVSIPDWAATRFAAAGDRDREAIGRQIDHFNALARQRATAAGAVFVDVTGLSRQYPDELVDDGLHPSAEHYARWVERIAPQAAAALA
jgi:lysophospholipase L1-like esterase